MQKGKDMDLHTLNKRHAFGVKSDAYGCIHWLDENTIAYPIGRNVVMHNIQSNAQKFFLTSEKTDSITAIALSPNKKFIAIAESGEHPQIQVVDTNTRKRRKVLYVTELGSDRFVCLQFSADGRHLATQGGAPQWNLLYWNWERSKPLAQVQVSRDQALPHSRDSNFNVVTHVTINPRDPLHVVVSGNGLFRFYRYVDGQLKPAPGGLGKAHTQNFTTHSWVTEDRIIVATDNADLLLIEDGEFRCPLPVAPSDNHGIYAIVPTNRGFVTGGDMGTINIFEQTDNKELYKKLRTLNIENQKGGDAADDSTKRCTIRSFALTHGEDMLAMATSNLQIYGLHFNVDWAKQEHPMFHSICQPFHAGPIVGLDTCIRKPLVATSSTDKTVRIWNIQEHTVEIIKSFLTEPGPVALHPSGLHLLVCFQEKVRFMNLYGDDIQEFKNFTLRSVSDVKFSVGGQYFAVAQGNVIQIYNTATCDAAPLAQLRGHSQRVRSLQWASTSQYPTDTRLVSCSTDGTVIDWSLREMRKESDHTDKRFQYLAVASNEQSIWVVGAPNSSQAETKWKVKLREIDVKSMHGDNVSNDFEFQDIFMNSLALAPQHRLMFGGCTDGSVKLMTFPLQGGIHDPPILAHASSVSRIAISHDESMLFTVGNDGSFYIFDIKEDGRTAKRDAAYAEEILISKSDLEEKTNTTTSLRQYLEELRLEMEFQEKRRGVQQDERIKELTDMFKDDAAAQMREFTAVFNAKQEQERTFTEIKREKADEHRHRCEDVERDKQSDLQEQEQTCKERRRALDEQRERFILELQLLEDEHERQRRDAQEAFQERMGTEQDKLHKLENAVTRNSQTHRETRSQLEIDTDAEIEGIRKKHEHDLTALREDFLSKKGKCAILKKNETVLQKEIEARGSEVNALEAAKAKLSEQKNELASKKLQLQAEIHDKDLTIGEKEKKIYELKKRNQDLEKHKFVLDHRIRQLKSQIEPKQLEIAKENEKIKAKDAELEQSHRNNLSLRTNIEDLKTKITQQQSQIKALLNRLKDFETYKSRVKTDVGELAQMVQDPSELRDGVSKMFRDHVAARGGKRCASLEKDLEDEYSTHTEFLSKTVESLKRKVETDLTQHKTEKSSVMAENMRLIEEINELRREIRNVRNAAGTAAGEAQTAHGGAAKDSAQQKGTMKEIEGNRAEIQRLRSKIEELEKSLTIRAQRPASRDRPLPPVSR